MSERHPYLDWPGPIAFAHRGGTSVAPENTLPAFVHAVGLGYRYLETDVHLSADGALVAFHDTDLTRTCGIDRRIADLTVEQLAEIRVGGEAEIPLMSDLFERFPTTRFNIDCKSDAAVGPLSRLIRDHDALDRVCIGSFSHDRLTRMRRELGSGLLTCASPPEVAALRFTGRIPARLGRGVQRVAQVPLRYGRRAGGRRGLTVVTPGFVRAAHRHGVPVHVWTINEADQMHRLLDLGVDGMMTDRPEILRDVLRARDQWYE